MDTYKIETPFESKFEDVRIYISEIKVEMINELTDGVVQNITPFTNVWHSAIVHHAVSSRTFVGRLYIIFRNQGKDNNVALSLSTEMSAKVMHEVKDASLVCMTVQYLFDLMNKLVVSENIKDNNGNDFVMPSFGYSASHFEGSFPD